MKESLKPLEPGCLALVFRVGGKFPKILNNIVTVVQKKPSNYMYRCSACRTYSGWWSIDQDIYPDKTIVCCSCCMVRIDPDEDQINEFKEYYVDLEREAEEERIEYLRGAVIEEYERLKRE